MRSSAFGKLQEMVSEARTLRTSEQVWRWRLGAAGSRCSRQRGLRSDHMQLDVDQAPNCEIYMESSNLFACSPD